MSSWVKLIVILVSVISASCAYKMGSEGRALPKNYRTMNIPIFKNHSMEPMMEIEFTNALIIEFDRSKVARIVAASESDVVLEGDIKKIVYHAGGQPLTTGIPIGSVLTPQYDIEVQVGITIRKSSDQTVVWAGEFSRTRSYIAPQVTLPDINSVDPLYNLSARRQNIKLMAQDMMEEAFGRITENF